MTTATYPRHYGTDAHARASAAYHAWTETERTHAFPFLAVQAATARYLLLAQEAVRASRAQRDAMEARIASECYISAGAPDKFGRPFCGAHRLIAFPDGRCSYGGTKIAEPEPLPRVARRYTGITATGETVVTYADGSWSVLDWTDSRAPNPQHVTIETWTPEAAEVSALGDALLTALREAGNVPERGENAPGWWTAAQTMAAADREAAAHEDCGGCEACAAWVRALDAHAVDREAAAHEDSAPNGERRDGPGEDDCERCGANVGADALNWDDEADCAVCDSCAMEPIPCRYYVEACGNLTRDGVCPTCRAAGRED